MSDEQTFGDPRTYTDVHVSRLGHAQSGVGESLGGRAFSLSVPERGAFALMRSGETESDLFHNVCTGAELQLSELGTATRWVFVPSYNRDGRALLNFEAAMPAGNFGATVVAIVVRGGKSFEAYQREYGALHVIIGMPDALPAPPTQTGEGKLWPAGTEFESDVLGIGFARHFIQRLAYALRLTWVWVLDDNVRVCFKRVMGELESEASGAAGDSVPCTFSEVMHGIERMMRGEADARPHAEAGRVCMADDGALIRSRPQPRASDARVTTAQQVMGGGADKYGLVGIHRARWDRDAPTSQFAVTHSVHCFVYLHVEATARRGVYYAPRPFNEDLEFSFLLDEAGLVCLKAYQYSHIKTALKAPPPVPAVRLPGLVAALRRVAGGPGGRLRAVEAGEIVSCLEAHEGNFRLSDMWAETVRQRLQREDLFGDGGVQLLLLELPNELAVVRTQLQAVATEAVLVFRRQDAAALRLNSADPRLETMQEEHSMFAQTPFVVRRVRVRADGRAADVDELVYRVVKVKLSDTSDGGGGGGSHE